MPDASLSIAVVGAEHIQVAARLSEYGQPVTLVVPDKDDFARLEHGLPAAAGVALRAEVPRADLRLGDAGSGADISLSWPVGSRPAALFSWSPSAPVVEVLGDVVPDGVQDLISRIGGTSVLLPPEAVPPSEYLWAVVTTEVERLMLTGASPVEIDDALEAHGQCALVKRMDVLGNERMLHRRDAVFQSLDWCDPPLLLARAVAEGRWGRSTGVGWYRYPGGGGPVEDPLVEDLAAEEAHFAKWDRRDVSAPDIVASLTRAKDDAVAQIFQGSSLRRHDVEMILRASVGWV